MEWINQKIKDRKILFFQIFLSQLVIILELVLPYLEGTIINQLIARNRILLYQLLFVLVIAFIARMVVSYFSSEINYSYIPQKSIYAQNEFVKDFYLKGTFALLKNAPSYLRDRVSNDIEEYIKYYYSTIPFIIGECTLIIYVSVFIYGLSFMLFLLC